MNLRRCEYEVYERDGYPRSEDDNPPIVQICEKAEAEIWKIRFTIGPS